jgi:hypothetical protein
MGLWLRHRIRHVVTPRATIPIEEGSAAGGRLRRSDSGALAFLCLQERAGKNCGGRWRWASVQPGSYVAVEQGAATVLCMTELGAKTIITRQTKLRRSRQRDPAISPPQKDYVQDYCGVSACVMPWGARLGRLHLGKIDKAMLDVGANQFDAELVADIEALSALCQ